MITEDGRLRYRVNVPPERGWRNRLRHVVNPVTGIVCGLVLAAALFLIAVQGLFGVRPSLIAIVLAVLAVAGYVVAVLRARTAAAARPRYQVTLDERGIAVDTAGFGWARFSRWLEDEHDFVVASGGVRDRLVVVVPKDGIPENEQELIRELLHAGIDPNDEPLQDAFVEMAWDEEPARRTAE